MTIAIELMLKAFIFSKNPILVFKDLPLELRVAFTSPESVGDDFKWRQYDVSLRSFEYKTIEMDELISTYYVFRPDLRQELQPFFKLFTQCRNVSIHASLPSFQKYELERTAYLAMRLFKEILRLRLTLAGTRRKPTPINESAANRVLLRLSGSDRSEYFYSKASPFMI